MIAAKSSITIGLLFALMFGHAVASELDDEDLSAMRAAARAYADAWLTNDADTVMATFVNEPVLSPSGLPYLEGQNAARAFWFPADSPSTEVTEFVLMEIEVSGSGNLGYVRGTFSLAFEYDGSSYENHGKYLTILRKAPDGLWRITHHIWDDLPQDN